MPEVFRPPSPSYGEPGRSTQGVGRLRLKDQLLALAAFTAATLVYTFPLAIAPARANRLDSPDALLNTWIVSWCVYQMPRDPFHLFDANIFFPEDDALAFSENLVTGALFAAPAAFFSSSPVLLYNTALFLGFVTTGYATFLLAFDVTGSRLASGLSGILFAFAPFRFAHIPHLQLQLAFGIPMMLLFARRILKEERGAASFFGLAAAFPLTFGSSVYYSVYAATVLPLFALRRGFLRFVAAGSVGSLLTLPLALPYWGKMSSGVSRPLETASAFSATASDYLSSSSRLHELLPKSSEPLFPGFVALGLAATAVLPIRRSWVWIGICVIGIAISLGPSLGLFSVLFELFPPYRALRVPSRAGVLFLLGIAVLAALGLGRVRLRAVRFALVALAAAECFHGPLPLLMEPPPLPAIYRHLPSLEYEGALLELPLPPPERFQDNAVYVYRSVFHRRKLVNGYSGFVPETYVATYDDLVKEPLLMNLERLSAKGVRYLLVHEARLGPRRKREIRDAEEKGVLALAGSEPKDKLYEIRITKR